MKVCSGMIVSEEWMTVKCGRKSRHSWAATREDHFVIDLPLYYKLKCLKGGGRLFANELEIVYSINKHQY